MKESFQGVELKELRNSIGFNQTQFSELTGIYQSSISKYENNVNEMTYNLFRFCEEKVKEYLKKLKND